MEAPHSKSHRSPCSSINEFAFHSARGSTFSEEEEEALTAADTRSEASCDTLIIRLNVGGTSFATNLGTLTAVPGSYFAALFGSGHWSPSVVPGSQTPFIDRDPESFKYVLSYLRCVRHADSHLALPDSPAQLRQLRAEAEFYNLPGLAQACSLGKWATAGLLCSTNMQQQHLLGAASWPGQLPPAQQQQQQANGMYREPTFSLLQRQHSSASGSSEPSRSSSLNGAMQAARDHVRHPHTAAGGLSTAASVTAAADAPVAGDDVMLTLQEQQPQLMPALAQCVSTAQQLRAVQQQAWGANVQWQQLADLILKHLLHLPLAAQQPDLVAALASPEPSARLEFLLLYYPVGEVRVEVECRVVPHSAALACTAAIAAAAAAGAGAAATAVCSSPSPQSSPGPRDPTGRASPVNAAVSSRPGTPVGSEAATAAAVAAAAAAAAGGVSGVTPGPGWGGVTAYHKYVIRETPEKFVLMSHMPGEGQAVAEAARGSFKQELNRYSTLHKLLVQQAPRGSVAGLMWLLESAGFSAVQLATQLETYYVGSNAFPGFRSVISFEL